MQQDLLLAGVGGQGILTIAKAISIAALHRGLHIKQAEVHGMSQRGGAVQSHLRISDSEIFSDIIGLGSAHLVIAVEPLESLRYFQYLGQHGAMVVSVDPFVNIPNYPAVEELLARIEDHPRHVMLDADRIARSAGSGRAANIAMLGAASLHLELEPNDLEEAVAEMFSKKGEKVVDVNRRAFRFGRNAALAYVDGLSRGATSVAVRHWLEQLPAEELAAPEPPDTPVLEVVSADDRLSGAEAHAVERLLEEVYEEGRRQLFEHEVYNIVQLVGAISPPHYAFVPCDELLAEDALAQFPGEQVVLKIVSPDIVHKTEASGISFVRKDYETVRREIDRMVERHADTADVRGVLVVEFVDRVAPGFGNELFVGIRSTREFGPVIAAGLGGIDTEYLAAKMKPGLAVAKAVATDITAEEFLELFKRTAAYEMLCGKARGHQRIVSDGELLRCFRAFIRLSQRFCVDRGAEGPDVSELEVNPFAFRGLRMVPLDGRGRLAPGTRAQAARPIETIAKLLEPKSMAILGVSSANARSFGRIILENVVACGFPKERITILKPGEKEIDGVRCVPSIRDLSEPVDLLVLAAGTRELPSIVDDINESGNARAVILIPGGVGETEGSEDLLEEVRAKVRKAHEEIEGGGAVYLGPNSLGVISRPGRYDTFFIPKDKLDKRLDAPARPVALLSQSGAFIVSRLSNFETLDPAIAISIGNQLDLTHADLVRAVGERDDIKTIGLYAEGFNDLDGQELLRTIGELSQAGKEIVFYKAGRTEQGRDAAAGHTASVAGDYDICQAGAEHAGAFVAETFRKFEQLLELSVSLHDKDVSGARVAAVSNAGFETVGIADSIHGPRHDVELAELSDESKSRLRAVLADYKLGGLVNVRNPMDITPMAQAAVYEHTLRVMLEADEVDAVVAGVIPLSPALLTSPDTFDQEGNLVSVLAKLAQGHTKPLVCVIDSGARYEPMVRKLREHGLAVFRSADQAIRSLGHYLCHRLSIEARRQG